MLKVNWIATIAKKDGRRLCHKYKDGRRARQFMYDHRREMMTDTMAMSLVMPRRGIVQIFDANMNFLWELEAPTT